MCQAPSHFTCADGNCLPAWWRCDGDIDCLDGSDELNCASAPRNILTCKASEFKCKYGIRCLLNKLVCDGYPDCPDGEDEASENCYRNIFRRNQLQCEDFHEITSALYCNGKKDCLDLYNCTRLECDKTEFDCGSGVCIPLSKVCDEHSDCPNSADESDRCRIDECAQNNGGCTQKCIDMPVGYHCDCEKGYKLINNTSCEDIDECLDPGVCSQICINENGTFKCECHSGYARISSDKTRCKAIEGHPLLLLARRIDIRKISLDQLEMVDIVNGTKYAVAHDYDFKTGVVFWSNVREQKIYKSQINEESKGGEKEGLVVIGDQLITLEGLAVDWIYKRLYWTDAGKKHIELSDLNGDMRKILIQGKLDEPRAITVNPLDGWMYWTDVGTVPKIERAGMDGTHRQIIVSNVSSPNGVVLDLVRERIFWVDSKLHEISSCNYDGTARRVILHSRSFLPYPFSITTFEDWLYWTDWNRDAVYRVNKFYGNQPQLIIRKNLNTLESFLSSEDMMVIHVYHPYRQPDGVNHCVNVHCSHWCLPAPQIYPDSPKTSCFCPNGLQLMPDNQTCTKDSKTRKNRTSQVVPTTVELHNMYKTNLDISSSADDSGTTYKTNSDISSSAAAASVVVVGAIIAEVIWIVRVLAC
nr:very low-density lipoprotein receptor-like [Maniola hyperantus]